MESPRSVCLEWSACTTLLVYYSLAVVARVCQLTRTRPEAVFAYINARETVPGDAAERVVIAWRNDRSFADGQGRPKALPFRVTGSHDLQEVILKAVPGSDCKHVLEQLLEKGYVTCSGRGYYVLATGPSQPVPSQLRAQRRTRRRSRPFTGSVTPPNPGLLLPSSRP